MIPDGSSLRESLDSAVIHLAKKFISEQVIEPDRSELILAVKTVKTDLQFRKA